MPVLVVRVTRFLCKIF